MDNARHWFHLERTQAQLTVRLQDMSWSQPIEFADINNCEQAIAQNFPASHILRAKPALVVIKPTSCAERHVCCASLDSTTKPLTWRNTALGTTLDCGDGTLEWGAHK